MESESSTVQSFSDISK